jgi:hypothetical protein
LRGPSPGPALPAREKTGGFSILSQEDSMGDFMEMQAHLHKLAKLAIRGACQLEGATPDETEEILDELQVMQETLDYTALDPEHYVQLALMRLRKSEDTWEEKGYVIAGPIDYGSAVSYLIDFIEKRGYVVSRVHSDDTDLVSDKSVLRHVPESGCIICISDPDREFPLTTYDSIIQEYAAGGGVGTDT